jgi:serine protease
MGEKSKSGARIWIAMAAALGALAVSVVAGMPTLTATARQSRPSQDPRQVESRKRTDPPGKRGDTSPEPAANTPKSAMLRQPGRPATVFNHFLEHARLTGEQLRTLYVPGHIVVKFAPGLSARTMQVMAGEVEATALSKPSYADFYYVMIPPDADPVAAAAQLSAQPDVIYAEPDAMVFPTYVPNDPFYRYQWHFQRIGMEQAWDVNRGGSSGVTVAIIDTGVAYLNKGAFAQAPDLAGTHFVAGYDFVWNTAEPVDLDGHGTHVTGTVAGTTNNGVGVAGMAFNASIMPVKVLYGDWDQAWNAPYPFGSSTVSRGIRFAADNGAKVINLSLGSFGPNTATLDALRYAVSKGVFVSISAGNDAETGNRPEWPAAYAPDIDGVVAVAALGYNLTRAPYSSIQAYVELAAPGGDASADLNHDGYGDGVLQQTYDSTAEAAGIFNRFAYVFYEGTSMAAPHVSALAALMIDQGYASPAAIEAAMKRFATDVPPVGRDNETGYGVINPRATLRGLGLKK